MINSFNYQRSAAKNVYHCRNLKHERSTKPTLIGVFDGGSGIIGSHVAKLILYTSLSLMCISSRNQKCLQQKTIFHNGFSDYFLLCSKRVVFIHEHRSDGRARNSWNPLPSGPRQKDGLFYFAKRNETKYMGEGEKCLLT